MGYYDEESLPNIMKDMTPAQKRRVTARALKIRYNLEAPEDVTEKKILEILEKLENDIEKNERLRQCV